MNKRRNNMVMDTKELLEALKKVDEKLIIKTEEDGIGGFFMDFYGEDGALLFISPSYKQEDLSYFNNLFAEALS